MAMAMATAACLAFPVCCRRSNALVASSKVQCSASPKMVMQQRRSANYDPNPWDYYSLQSLKGSYSSEAHNRQYEQLKKEVKKMIHDKEAEPAARLKLVDDLQRLGVAYHFEEDIQDVLNLLISTHHKTGSLFMEEDVSSMALMFRLLRENRLPATQELLSGLKDDKGTFKASLQKDIKGLLSLYEASHLAFGGESLLDEARVFTTKHLKDLKPSSMDASLKDRVAHSLDIPLHWRAPRFEAMWYLNQYERDESMEPLVLQFAKLDFNLVQSVHQGELADLTRWWTDRALRNKLEFARDRFIESFHFATGTIFEPHHGDCRDGFTKVAILIVYIDDTYDLYGTLDELVLFTEVVGRWENGAMENLPEYMKPLYSCLLSTTHEIAEGIRIRDGWDALPLLRKSWQDLCNAYLMEAKWYHGGLTPSLEEYADNGWMSISGPLLLNHVFALLREKVTPEALKQIESYPRLVQTSSLILRLCNDSGTHSAESARGDAPSSIACYMRQHGVNEEDSRKAMQDLTMDVWKKINEDALGSRSFSRSFANASMNLARTSHCVYKRGDGFGAPDEEKNNQTKSLFLEPVKARVM